MAIIWPEGTQHEPSKILQAKIYHSETGTLLYHRLTQMLIIIPQVTLHQYGQLVLHL
ncbi:MAG: hypothetical protein CM15mV84_170 [uncultured marine virus]|nr:MAG: hypothetical protein CM15mV84_170 [uncultured marine virus]